MPYTTLGSATAGQVYTATAHNAIIGNLNSLGPAAFNVQQTALTNAFTQTITTTFADVTGFTVSITPSAATSKILIFTYLSSQSDTAVVEIYFRLARNGNAIFVGDAASNRVRATGSSVNALANEDAKITPVFLDSPATTSAVTYSVQARTSVGTGTLYFNRTKTDTDAATFSRSASSIVVMEIPV